MAEPGTFDVVVAEIGQALLPLREALASPAAFTAFLQKLGWRAEDIPQPVRDLGAAAETLFDTLHKLLGDGGVNVGGSLGSNGSAGADISADDVARALRAIQDLIGGIRAIAAAPDSAFPAPLLADGFKTEFPRQLLDHLIITYLRRFHPSVAFALRSLGVIKATYVPQTGGRPPHVRVSLDLTDLPKVLGDPSLVLKNAFGWGGPDFDFAALAAQVDNLLMAIGVSVAREILPVSTSAAVQGPAEPDAPKVRALKAIVFERVQPSGRMAAELRLLPLPARDGALPGLALMPSYSGVLDFRLELGPDIAVILRSDLDLQGGVALRIRPGRGIDLLVGFDAPGSPAQARGSLAVTAERGSKDAAPVVLLGSPDSTRLQFRKVAGTGGIRLVDGDVDVFAEFELRGLEFVFDPSDADGFIAKVLPDGGFSFGADLMVGVAHSTGFYFRGTAGLEIQLPVHVGLGPVDIQSLTISAMPSGDRLPIGLGASFKVELGPVKAAVEQVGLSAELAFRSGNDGNLGPLDLSLGFQPPKGAGLSIDAGVVSGGGYLAFFPDKGEYSGALELEFSGLFELKAIGLITTRMPDGSPGFSLLLVLIGEFGTGIQLGFGFTLLAVGGLLGLNRRMNLQALVEGVRTGAIESVMFPRDVVANAPRILSDLRAFFPAEQGKFLIGPMAKLGWGTPTLVSVSLAVIIEIPGNIAILGVLTCVLPDADAPLLVLQVNFIGAVEFDKQRLFFYAQLFDSRVLFMTIEGGMGLLVAWGDSPDLVLSVGGFHPSFKPPPLPFPVPPRISVDILNRPGQLIRVSGYFAVTSNTVQFGASAELQLGFDDFGIKGHLSFDALFQFSPFRFVIAISASVSLRAFGIGLFGIDLRFQLEGPAPWRAHGRGSISLLFFEIGADFDITWGESRDTTLPPVDVLPLLVGELDKLEGWQTRLPSGGTRTLVSLRPLPPTDDLVLHPLGSLLVRQRALPLGVRLDRIGAQRPRDGKRFTVEPVPGGGLARVALTSDKFAMAQFQDMDDAAKLSRPAYEDQDAGLELAAAQGALASARVVRRSARYEQIVVDSRLRGPRGTVRPATRTVAQADGEIRRVAATAVRAKRLTSVSPAVFGQMLRGSSTSRSALSRREAELRQPFAAEETVRVTGPRFVVAYVRNNLQAFPPVLSGGAPGSAASSFRSRAAAQDAVVDWVTADPGLADRLHVVPEAEAAAPPAAAETWTAAGALPSALSWVSADEPVVRLGSGKLLVAGGLDAAGSAVASAALFDPIAGTWTATGALGAARQSHTLTPLKDGRALAVGGRGTGPLGTAEVYDPLTGSWSGTASALRVPRFGHSATLLPGGRVLVAGGVGTRTGSGGAALASAELYDPATGTWTDAAPMTDARSGHRAVPLPSGKVLVIGGALATGGGDTALAYCELYDPAAGATGAWTPTGSLLVPRKGHQATLLPDGTVLVTGGDAPDVLLGRTYDPAGLRQAERYDPATGAWTPVRDMPGARGHHRAVLLRSGRVLVVGGASGPSYDIGFRSTLAYDPVADTWTRLGALATGRADFMAVELADGRVLAAGGRIRSAVAAPDPGADVLTATAELFTP
ncbi:DUF6603 domain-containing protein [Streptomyces sp. FR-108]|uniref:DUF6603 domain-containing protein n=1 Tax=Streptomyces sp. FR-108 TaxID=3416665 RepID=UPI003CF21D27